MATNKDGLEAGQPVEFDTILRVERERAQRAKRPTESKPAAKRSTRARATEE